MKSEEEITLSDYLQEVRGELSLFESWVANNQISSAPYERIPMAMRKTDWETHLIRYREALTEIDKGWKR